MSVAAKRQWARAERAARNHSLEHQLSVQLHAARLDAGLYAQYRFTSRRWRLDFAYPAIRLGIEIHGGTFIAGAHSRGARQREDFEKANALTLAGWRLLVFDTTMIRDGTALQTIESAVQQGD